MHDLSYFRNNLDAIAERLATRGFQFSLDRFRELDASRRAAIRETEELKARKNAAREEIGKLKRQGVDTSEQQKQIRELGERISGLDKNVAEIDEEFKSQMAGIPNIPDESVPVGKSSEDNVEIRRCGQPRQFDFEP